MKRFLFFLSLLLPGLLLAGNIPEEQARRVAMAFWQSAPQTRGVSPVSWRLVLQSEGIATRSAGVEPAYYVYDNVSGPGFVIVAGDDVAMPVLGYSFENEFPQTDRLPANLRDWLNGLREEILAARRNGLQADAAVAQAWQNVRVGNVVVELETARWNQEDPYNRLCPRVNGQASYTGCTATAAAIVMRYHQWPARGTGVLPGYTTGTYGVNVPELQLGYAYDWANMPLDYARNCTQAQADAVATLMRDVGVMLQSDYGPLGSGGTAASIVYIPLLATHLGYDKNVRYLYRPRYSTQEWHELLRAELDDARPVIYTGSNGKGEGHAFVLDGYDTQDFYSVNWGWGGHYDGYFLLSALEPAGQGAGGSDGGYNKEQWATIGIQKDTGGGYLEDVRFQSYEKDGRLYNGFTVEEEIVQNVPFTLHFGLMANAGMDVFVGEFMIAMADKDGQIVEQLWSLETDNLDINWGYALSKEVTITQPIRKGHRIRAYYRSAKTPQWTLVRGNEEEGCVWDLVLLDEYTIEESTVFTYDKSSRQICLIVKDGVTASLTDASGKDYGQVCLNERQSVTIDAALLPAGTYTLTLRKGKEQKELRFTIGEPR